MPSGGSSPSLGIKIIFFLHILLSVSPLAFQGCSFLPRIPLGSGCLNVCIGVRLLGISVVWYICIYVYVIYRYMGIYCVSYTNIFFFFGPYRFFPFRHPVPRDVPSLRRWGSYLVWFRRIGFVPLSSPASACDVTRCVVAAAVAPIGCFLNGDTFLAASVDVYTFGGGLHRAFSFSPPFLIMSTFWCCCLEWRLPCPGL